MYIVYEKLASHFPLYSVWPHTHSIARVCYTRYMYHETAVTKLFISFHALHCQKNRENEWAVIVPSMSTVTDIHVHVALDEHLQ